MDKVIAKRVLARVLSDRTYVRAVAQLHHGGNAHPYFSLTGEEYTNRAVWSRGHEPRACGQMHDVLVDAIPELALIAALHLSDDHGVPMHAVENGWYWYEQGELATCAKHLRVSLDDLPGLPTKEAFAEYVDTLRERWQREADEALAYLQQ